MLPTIKVVGQDKDMTRLDMVMEAFNIKDLHILFIMN